MNNISMDELLAKMKELDPDFYCNSPTALKLTDMNLTVNLRPASDADINLRPVSSSASPEQPDPLRGSREQEGYFAAQQAPLRGAFKDAASPRPNAREPQQGEPLRGSEKSDFSKDVEARLAARSGGWKWAQVQYWSNVGVRSKAGRPMRPAVKVYMGNQRGNINSVFYADVMPFEELKKMAKRMPSEARGWAEPWLGELEPEASRMHRYGFVRSQAARGVKGSYTRNAFVVLIPAEERVVVSILGVAFSAPLKSYEAEKPNAPDLKGYWNGPEETDDN